MQTFKGYLSNRNRYLKLGEAARGLALMTDDPEGLILDLVEDRMPHLHGPLLEAFYLEADEGPTDMPPGTPAPVATGEEPPARPAGAVAGGSGVANNASDSGSIMDWLRNLFGGGGAEKSFGRAMTALTKVDSVLKTIHIPAESQAEGSPAAGYDQYKKDFAEMMEKIKELATQSKVLNVADAIKKDPNYVQELQNNPVLAGEMKKDAAEAAAEKKTGDAGGGGASAADTMAAHNKPVNNKVVGEEMHKATNGDFTGFGANADEAKEEWEKIKAMPNEDPKKHERWAYIMRYLKHARQDEVYLRRGKVIRENVFSEALVLAGIPARRNK